MHQSAQMLRRLACRTRRRVRRVRALSKPPRCGEPERHGEVVERDDRLQPMRAAGLQHLGVMIEFGVGEEALARLDARPLDAHAIAVEAELRGDGDVFGVAVIAVAGIAGAFLEERRA